MWNLVAADTEPIDGKVIAGAVRERTIVPACIIGNLRPGLDRACSVEIGILATAEMLRRSLRNLRDLAGGRRY